MNSNDGLDYRVFRDQLQDVDGASQYLQEVFEMLRDTKPAVCALMRQYGYDKINGSTFASQRARLFAEHVLQFKPITIARNVTVQGDESLREEDLLTLAKAVNEDQKWANEIYLRVTFPRKFFSMFYDVELNPTDVLLKLAVRQQAMW
jgi:adenosine deaminase